MTFIWAFLGTTLGIIGTIAVIFFIIYLKIRSVVGKNNIKELKNVIKNRSNLQMEEYSREKSVSGLTTLLEPVILEDFPDFNKDLLFSTVEINLRKILEAIEDKSLEKIKEDKNLSIIYSGLEKIIEDYRENNINVEYNDIKFHRHAIKDYRKRNGKATVKISSTLEYYYKSNKRGDNVFENIKKQTRYTTEFCYIYDDDFFEEKQVGFSVNCPNCGAPFRKLGFGKCEYCNSQVEVINLKAWKMISYKEDYK